MPWSLLEPDKKLEGDIPRYSEIQRVSRIAESYPVPADVLSLARTLIEISLIDTPHPAKITAETLLTTWRRLYGRAQIMPKAKYKASPGEIPHLSWLCRRGLSLARRRSDVPGPSYYLQMPQQKNLAIARTRQKRRQDHAARRRYQHEHRTEHSDTGAD